MLVSVKEKLGSAVEQIDKEGASATRVFTVPWEHRIAFVNGLLGSRRLRGGFLRTTRPKTYPGFSDPVLFAQSASIKPIVTKDVDHIDSLDFINYKWAEVAITYKTADPEEPDQNNETIAEVSFDVGAEYLSLPEGSHTFEGETVDGVTIGGGEGVGQSVGLVIPTMDFELAFEQAPRFNKAKYLDQIGTVNQSSFEGCDPEHVLFLGATARRSFTTKTVEFWKLSLKFSARKRNWNELYNPTRRAWARVTPSIYEKSDFRKLVQL